MSGPLPPKPKIDLNQYLNNDGTLKKQPISQQLRPQPDCRDDSSLSPVHQKSGSHQQPDTLAEAASNLRLSPSAQDSSLSSVPRKPVTASKPSLGPKPVFASNYIQASKQVFDSQASYTPAVKSSDGTVGSDFTETPVRPPKPDLPRPTPTSKLGKPLLPKPTISDTLLARPRHSADSARSNSVSFDPLPSTPERSASVFSSVPSRSARSNSVIDTVPLNYARSNSVADSELFASNSDVDSRPFARSNSVADSGSLSRSNLVVNSYARSNSVVDSGSFARSNPVSEPVNSKRSNSVVGSRWFSARSNSVVGSVLESELFKSERSNSEPSNLVPAKSTIVTTNPAPAITVNPAPSIAAPSNSAPSNPAPSNTAPPNTALRSVSPGTESSNPERAQSSPASSETAPPMTPKPVPPPLPYRPLNSEVVSPSPPKPLQRSLSQSSASPDKSQGGRTYAPKPINESVPLKSHQADHRSPSQVPTNFLKAKARRLLAANDRYICVTTSSKTQLYSWRTSSLVWELKGASVAAAFVPETDTVWISPTSSTGKIFIISLTTGETILDLGRGHMKPVTFLASTHYGIVSLSSDDGKVNVWAPVSDGLPIITQRIPVKSALASSGGNDSSILWTCRDHQVSAYKPSSSPLPFVSVSLPRRGARLGAITSIASFGDMAFFGQNDGFITTFKGASQLGAINGGIYSITALTAPSSTELWAGTRSGDILIFALHTHLQENSIQLSATLLRQWRAHSSSIVQILLADDKAAVLSTDRQGTVCCWNSTPADVLALSPSTSEGYLVQVLTWNIGNSTPQQAHPTWFFDPDTYNADIVVIGLQEVLDLESTSQHALKLLSNGDALPDGEHHKWKQYLEMLFIPNGFTLVVMKPLVGLMACLFVKRHLVEKLSDVGTQVVRTGIHGAYGNKGGVVLSFKMAGMTWCFANCHLAAGHSAFMQRNRDASQILNTPKPLQSDVCFFFGDTNYRINAAREQAEQMIKANNWDQLRKHDQLLSQIFQLPSFCLGRFQEGVLNFAPTYKYDPGTSRYDTSDKQRIPSWCDRILYRGKSIHVTNYTDVNTTSSDHKAVRGTYKVPQLYQHA